MIQTSQNFYFSIRGCSRSATDCCGYYDDLLLYNSASCQYGTTATDLLDFVWKELFIGTIFEQFKKKSFVSICYLWVNELLQLFCFFKEVILFFFVHIISADILHWSFFFFNSALWKERGGKLFFFLEY